MIHRARRGSSGFASPRSNVFPSDDELITISFSLHPVRNRPIRPTNIPHCRSIDRGRRQFGSRIPPATKACRCSQSGWLLPNSRRIVELNTSMPTAFKKAQLPCHSAVPEVRRPVRPRVATKPIRLPKSVLRRSIGSAEHRRCRTPGPTPYSNFP